MSLTVGDLFCGAGGFAEGFRQAGFEITWAIDNWEVAARTFEKNQPGTDVRVDDVLTLDPSTLEPVDVLIGSPPCTYFSLANRGGGGDKEAGYAFVSRYLELVRELDPDYWIMENVPQLKPLLEEQFDGDLIALDGGGVPAPVMEILRADAYGTPQLRRRLFTGNFPVPREANIERSSDRLSIGSVLERLPDPCGGQEDAGRWAMDPVYRGVKVSKARLRDHFEDSRWSLGPDQLRQCEVQKQGHRVYGRMDFPDRGDRPSRTITAVHSHSSRSTIVVECPHHPESLYRTLTLRECASLQGFPITYNFWADTITEKDRMVGNAVPPTMARAIAEAILEEKGLPVLNPPLLYRSDDVPPPLYVPQPGPPRYPLRRRFRSYALSDWQRNCRVELDNEGEEPGPHPSAAGNHLVEWVTRVYLGYSEDYRCYQVSRENATAIAEGAVNSLPDDVALSLRAALSEIAREADRTFEGSLPDATTLQRGWARKADVTVSPFDIIDKAEEITDRHLPSETWGARLLPRSGYTDVLRPILHAHGARADDRPPRDLTARSLGVLLALSAACDKVNNGVQVNLEHQDASFVP